MLKKQIFLSTCLLISSFAFANHPNCGSHCPSTIKTFDSTDPKASCPKQQCKCGPAAEVKNCKSYQTHQYKETNEQNKPVYTITCSYGTPSCP